MNGSAQRKSHEAAIVSGFARNARQSFMGSKIIQAIGVEPERLDAVHHAMLLRLIDKETGAPLDECDQLAAHIVAIARVADDASASGGSKAAIAALPAASTLK